MPRAYTKTQAEADSIDCDMHRLMCRAEYLSESKSILQDERLVWQTAYLAIASARSSVRELMHPKTRDETFV